MIKFTSCLLALCSAALGQNINLQTNPVNIFLQGISPVNFRGNNRGIFSAQRLPVNGLGFSNPPPPLGSGQDSATQSCGLIPPFCVKSRYRTIDGSCNNLLRPTLGTSQTPFGRLVPYKYGDGISSLPTSLSGKELPNARLISNFLFSEQKLVDPVWNLNAPQWGQIIAHDMSHAANVAQNPNNTVICCDDNGQLTADAATNPLCAPILIPINDKVHSQLGTQCMTHRRTSTTRDIGCTPPYAPAQQLSRVTAYMDASFCYGSSDGQARSIRAFVGGRLRTKLKSGREYPPQDHNVTLTCLLASAKSPIEPCYLAGDIRVNQHPQLTILQIIVLREHNRVADVLAVINPHWNDETLYQEARRIVIAELQYINYYEYLPILLGFENMVKNKLIYPGAKGYINDYNPKVDPSVLDEHATAAFRHFHTLIRGYLKMVTESRHLAGVVRLSDWFNRPMLVEVENAFDDLTRGLTYQPQGFSDQLWDSEITQYLFKRNNSTYGRDLRAMDIQRGRDHGLGSYVTTRAACGLPMPHSFDDMLDFISGENVEVLKTIYEYAEDVDLVVGGSLEFNVPGAQAGPTFLCILTEQFYRTRVGDRYFFENGDPDMAFTPSQLQSIRKGASMARILCDNSNNIRHMQPKAFQQISHGNMPVPCHKLPSIDLSLWQDYKFQ